MNLLDDHILIELLISVAALARRDAEKGDHEALAWLQDVRTATPPSLFFAADGEDNQPVRLRPGGRRRAGTF